jgi:hypothetical protein
MEAAAPESQSFVHRVIRVLALVALALGVLNAITLVVFTVSERWSSAGAWFGGGPGGYLFYAVGSIGLVVLQIAGAVGLLRWKSWGRTLLLVWSLSSMLFSLFVSGAWTYQYLQSVRATTQASYQPNVGSMIWNTFHFWAQGCAFPLLTWLALRRAEVKALWATPRHGGFDVIPIAKAAIENEANR